MDDINVLMHYFKNRGLWGNKHKLSFTCPLHTEQTPSFTINIDDETYHCFGCQANGQLVDLQERIRAKAAVDEFSATDLDISGFAKMVLNHCIIREWNTDDQITMVAEPQVKPLLNERVVEAIEKSISTKYNRPVFVFIECDGEEFV